MKNHQLIGLLFTFNILDAIFTIAWIEMGIATEANPILAPLVGTSVVFMLSKISIGMFCGFTLMNSTTNRLVKPLAVIGLLVYGMVIVYHLLFFIVL